MFVVVQFYFFSFFFSHLFLLFIVLFSFLPVSQTPCYAIQTTFEWHTHTEHSTAASIWIVVFFVAFSKCLPHFSQTTHRAYIFYRLHIYIVLFMYTYIIQYRMHASKLNIYCGFVYGDTKCNVCVFVARVHKKPKKKNTEIQTFCLNPTKFLHSCKLPFLFKTILSMLLK